MAITEAKIKITAEDDISSVISKVSDALGDTGLGQAVTAVSTAFTALNQVAGIVSNTLGKVFDVMGQGISFAAQAEQANKRLALSMLNVGDFTEEAFDATLKWAGALEAATGESDETFKSLASLGIEYGLTADQAKKAAEAAFNYSKATGEGTKESLKKLAETMTGVTGEMSKFIPEMRNLTKEQLQNGAAIDLIAKKYDGFGAKTAKTFDGAMGQISTQIDNVLEAFGEMIAQNPAVVAAMNKVASVIGEVAVIVNNVSDFIVENSESIKNYAIGFGIAAIAVGGFAIAMNAATIAQTAMTVATIIFNTAMAVTPWGIALVAIAALTIGIGFLIDSFDELVGTLKVGVGETIIELSELFRSLTEDIANIVGIFDEELAASIRKVSEDIAEYGDEWVAAGEAQIKAGEDAKSGAKEQQLAGEKAKAAISGVEEQAKKSNQEFVKMQNIFTKSQDAAKAAFEAVKDFTPRIQLEQLNKDVASWEASLDKLQKDAENLKINIEAGLSPNPEEDAKQLENIKAQIANAEDARNAIALKSAIQRRELILKEEELAQTELLLQVVSTEEEVKRIRVENGMQIREQLVQIETDRLLEEANLNSAGAQAGISIQTEAALALRQIKIDSAQATIDAEQTMLISAEQEIKQLRIVAADETRARLIEIETQRLLSQKGLQSVASQDSLTIKQRAALQANQIEIDTFRKGLEDQKALLISVEQEKQTIKQQFAIDTLGTDTIAGQRAQAQLEIELQTQKLEQLKVLREDDLISIEEFELAKTELEIQQKELRNELSLNSDLLLQEREITMRDNHTNRQIALQEKLGNRHQVELLKIERAQERHGQAMGTIIGASQTARFAAVQQGLNNISTLQNTKSRELFEIGQAAAVANAVVSTSVGAAKALEFGPILGPILAAAQIAAGAVQIATIKSQKFGGQAHDGIESIPQSLSNSSFILQGGERVIKKDQNKGLGQAIDTINGGNGGGGNTINLTVNGDVNDSQIEKIKTTLIEVLREASERGEPVINEKGIVRG